MENKKTAIAIIILIILIVCAIIGYMIKDISFGNETDESKENETENKVENKEEQIDSDEDSKEESNADKENIESDEDIEENMTFENFNYDDITEIVLQVPCAECDDPETDEIILNKEKDIKYILSNLDKVEFISKLPEESGIGSIGAMTIEIIYSDGDDPSTQVVFLNNGNVAINYSVGVAETTWGEYKLSNSGFEKELLDTFQK